MRKGTLADLTCDSDGKIDRFVDDHDIKKTLELHELREGEDYYLGAFLVGAYQETLGDLHNLFGDTHVAHIRLDENNQWWIDEIVEGDSVREVLHYVQYDATRLAMEIRREVEGAVRTKGGGFSEGAMDNFTGSDFRFTRKGDAIYAIAMDWPGAKATIRSFASGSPLVQGDVRSVELLGVKGKLTWRRTAQGLEIDLPAERPCDHAYAFKVTGLKGVAGAAPATPTPTIATITPDADGSITLANLTNVGSGQQDDAFAEIGDGPFGLTTGDYDWYKVVNVRPDQTISVETLRIVRARCSRLLVSQLALCRQLAMKLRSSSLARLLPTRAA